MVAYGIPRGVGGPSGGASLVSFGSSNTPATAGDRLLFSGDGAVSAVPKNSPPQVLVAGLDAFDYILGFPFVVDKTGMGAQPFKDSVVQWTYHVKASTALSEEATWADLSDRLNRLYAWFWGTYAYTSPDGSTTYSGARGQKGDLIVLDAHGVAYVAPAVWVSFPDKIPPGQVTFASVDLVFHLLSHFVSLEDAGGGGSTYGTGHYGVGRYA